MKLRLPMPDAGRSDLRPQGGVVASVYLARALRDFGDGFVAILLPVYLVAIGLGSFEVGIVSAVALFGSTAMTLGIGYAGSRLNQRTLLIWASTLMVATGLAYSVSETYAVILLVAFVGTINPSAGSSSIFVPLEHTVLSRSVADADRTQMFARYSLSGALAAALGAFAAAGPDALSALDISQLVAIKAMFVIYALLGIAGGCIYARIPPASGDAGHRFAAPLGPSKTIVYKMAALFGIDSFAGGLVVQSLLALWLFNRFDLSVTAAAAFFFWSGVLSAFSFPVAAWLSKRIGLVNTMVFTHLPSSLCLILAALAPTLEIALALLLVRAALSQMDVPTRSSYVMAVVTPAERPAAASVTSVARSLSSVTGPAIAGALFAAGLEIWPLIACGVLKITYDLALLCMFRDIKPPEEQ